ncbi:Hypothetical_protein [Hexamita inflata]|uniref:Hypothetical_protein n=1 Tax=Hexamita inflata TaxID=28002 RepID=A0AA86NV77_9EUKA|nr:Hypothetical protein HINF_LOCUS14104 [Hexamita inflata]
MNSTIEQIETADLEQRQLLADILYGEQIKFKEHEVNELKSKHVKLYNSIKIVPDCVERVELATFDGTKRFKLPAMDLSKDILYAGDLTEEILMDDFQDSMAELAEEVQMQQKYVKEVVGAVQKIRNMQKIPKNLEHILNSIEAECKTLQ